MAKIGGTLIIVYLQNMLISSQVDEIIIVLGANEDEIKPYILNHRKVKVVYNKDYNLGQTSSFKVGLKKISGHAQGVMLLPVDYPLVKAQTVDLLIEQFNTQRPFILIPTYQNKKGHPPVFHIRAKDGLLQLENTLGLNAFQHRHASEIFLCPLEDRGVVSSFNTPEEFESLKQVI